MSEWVQHCKMVQNKHGCTYRQAMQLAKNSWKKDEMVGGSVSSYMANIKERGYNSGVKKILAKWGNEEITEVVIKRTPVSSVLTGLLNMASFGKFSERQKEKGYDSLFHLYVQFKLSNGKYVSCEKQEQINMRENPHNRAREGEEQNVVYGIPSGLTLLEVMNKTQKYMGKNFFTYSAHGNNCQNFIQSLFKANGFGQQNDFSFIKQDTESIFQGLSKVKKLSTTVTNAGHQFASLTDFKEIKNKKEVPIISDNQPTTLQPDNTNTNDNQNENQDEQIGMGIRSAKNNKWILHVKAYAKKNNLSYWKAIKEARPSYK